ncbi:uncharacterized protein [Dermacentor albipictus]|uniref:uncharacterized protein n=1 Tax=Dermacentor albipictus TaxID=60249 RepID=UPI0038FC43A1
MQPNAIRWRAWTPGFIGILYVMSCLLFQQTMSCNRQLPPFGPRLFRAKALFGQAMRSCSKEILAAAKMIPSEKLGKLLFFACRLYNTCKDSIPEKEPEQLVECFLSGVRNEVKVATPLGRGS